MSSNPYAASYPYDGGEHNIECPKCKRINTISIILQDGHNEREECFCAGCGESLGEFRAALPPTVR